MSIVTVTLPNDGDEALAANIDNPINAILAVLNGSIDADNLADNGITQGKLATAVQALLVPTGLIAPFAGSSAPSGWLLCYGQSVANTDYPSLYSAIGTAYGNADSSHFNIPDLRGRVAVGASAMGGTSASRIEHSTTLSLTSGSPTGTVGSASGLAVGMVIVSAGVTAGTTITAISSTTITMSANATSNETTTAARFSMIGPDPEALGATGGEDAHTATIPEMPAHTHQTSAGVVTGGTNYGSIVNGPTGSVVASLMASTGGGLPHNNIQPSLITNYIIKT